MFPQLLMKKIHRRRAELEFGHPTLRLVQRFTHPFSLVRRGHKVVVARAPPTSHLTRMHGVITMQCLQPSPLDQMPFEVTPLIPVIGTVAAALVAGGIGRANLIASKESKISEFRQAWINALRDDLAALFSNTRTLARAIQEDRVVPPPMTPDKFAIEPSKITAVRHGAAETYHRIRLRLNSGQPDHAELLRLIEEMMTAQQNYVINKKRSVSEPIDAVEKAALYAERVLKAEWNTVKAGEKAYQDAVRTTKFTLVGSFAVLALLVVGYPIYYWTASARENKEASPTRAVAAPAPKAPTPTPAPLSAPLPRPAAGK